MCSYRPGGLDLFAQSFMMMDPKDEYEVVICDDYPGRVERGEAEKFLRSKCNLGWYGKSWERNYPTKGGLVRAWNTALSHCKGDYVVFVSDYSILYPTWA